jgi:hypothetical protein
MIWMSKRKLANLEDRIWELERINDGWRVGTFGLLMAFVGLVLVAVLMPSMPSYEEDSLCHIDIHCKVGCILHVFFGLAGVLLAGLGLVLFGVVAYSFTIEGG